MGHFIVFSVKAIVFYYAISAISVALGALPDFASALKNRGWAKSDSCGIALAGPPAPGGRSRLSLSPPPISLAFFTLGRLSSRGARSAKYAQ